eukprot:5573519-Prymnesium_polylepis.1
MPFDAAAQAQFRVLIKDLHLDCSGMQRAQIDNIFVRANREYEEDGNANKVRSTRHSRHATSCTIAPPPV